MSFGDELRRRRVRLRPLSAEDAARLHMGVAENPMTVTALLVLDAPLTRDAVLAILEERLLCHDRFRLRILEPRLGLGMPRWAEDPGFDLRRHLEEIEMSGGDRELEDVLSTIASTPLDPRRPLWRMHLVSGVAGASALVVTVHHALADGAALLDVLAGLVDDAPTPADEEAAAPPKREAKRGRQLLAGLVSAGRLAIRRADPPTPLRGRLGADKRIAFSSALPLDALLATAHAHGTTVPGVLLAAVAGTLRGELRPEQRERGLVLHALLPISVPREDPHAPGNRYGSVYVPLAVGSADITERVQRARDGLRALRARSAVTKGVRLAAAAGVATAPIERLGVAFFSRKASVMVSNVRGPSRPLKLAGSSLRDLLVWAPSPGSIALGITLMSYAGRARIGVSADAAVIGDPRRIVSALELELAALANRGHTAPP